MVSGEPRLGYWIADDATLEETASFKALEFLERSRDVANEVVVDGKRREISTSRGEESAASDSGIVV